MKTNVRQKFVWLWLVSLSVAMGVAVWHSAASDPTTANFHTINAQRINIIQPDGKYSLVIANRQNMPGNYFQGKEYKRPGGHRSGGLLFFNDSGDEVGGLDFGDQVTKTGYSASSGLMFDQYQQDQTVGVIYRGQDGKQAAGLQVWDRPDYSIQPLLEMNAERAATSSEEQRENIQKQMLAYAKAHGGLGETRMFVGKQDGVAEVDLSDGKGHPRLVLKVDKDGNASIEFLNEQGKVTREISAGAATEKGQCCNLLGNGGSGGNL